MTAWNPKLDGSRYCTDGSNVEDYSVEDCSDEGCSVVGCSDEANYRGTEWTYQAQHKEYWHPYRMLSHIDYTFPNHIAVLDQ